MKLAKALSVLFFLVSTAAAGAVEQNLPPLNNILDPMRLDRVSAPIAGIPALAPVNLLSDAEPVPAQGWGDFRRDADARLFAPVIVAKETMCDALAAAAASHDLPLLFFARLIWQESRFNRWAVSRAGAQGVAQFMPATAAEMGLLDPFDPLQALPMSARFLGSLHKQFGNWGLAAAAYNAGPGRIRQWLTKRGKLPKETRNYVKTITGLPAERWVKETPDSIELKLPSRLPCDNLPESEMHAIATPAPGTVMASLASKALDKDDAPTAVSATARTSTRSKQWTVQITAHWKESQARAGFTRLQKRHPKILGDHKPIVTKGKSLAKRGATRKRVHIAVDTRASANRLCAQLKAAGGACIVQRNASGSPST